MARSLHTASLIAALSAFAAAVGPLPAQAQFNPFEALFGSPPRPPAGVPSGRPVPQPQYDPYEDQRFERRPYPPQQQGYPQYPQQEQPYPPQANVPTRPPGGIQSQPLPPPPGTAAVDPRAPGVQPPQAGLPPGPLPPRGAPQPSDTSPQPGDEVVVEPPSQ